MQHISSRTELSARALISVFLLLVFSVPQAQAIDIGDTDSQNSLQLQFDLAEKKSTSTITTASVTPLSADRTKRLLEQLNQLTRSLQPAPASDAHADEPLHVIDSEKPPEASQTLQFPQSANTPSNHASLKITSHTPTGAQPLASDVSVHFSEQMIPLETIQTSQKKNIPITISPPLAGSWEWLDPYTATFKHQSSRFPMATHYTITVSQELKSLAGKQMDKDFTWTVDTPPVHEMNWLYSDWCKKNNLIPVSFDQRVNADKILPFLHLKDAGKEFSLEVAPDSQWAGLHLDSTFYQGSVVMLRPSANTPQLKKLNLELSPGSPAEEGPLCSKETLKAECEIGLPPFAWESWIKTTKHKYAKTYVDNIERNRDIAIRFNYLLNTSNSLSDLLTISPPIPDLQVSLKSSMIVLYGTTEYNRTYTINLNPKIQDVYGRALGPTHPLTVNIRKQSPVPTNHIKKNVAHQLINQYQPIFVLSPQQALAPEIAIRSINDKQLKVKIFEVTADDWRMLDNNLLLPQRKPVFDKTIQVQNFKSDKLCQTSVNLQPYLKSEFGQLLVDVSELPEKKPADQTYTPQQNHRRRWSNSPDFKVWVEKTDLSVHSNLDQNKLVCFVTSLKTGRPCVGATVNFDDSNKVGKTDANGLCEMPLTASKEQKVHNDLIRVASGADAVILPGAISSSPGKQNIFDAFTDKNLYKPGETVNVKGWMRFRDDQPLADLSLMKKTGTKIFYKVKFGNQEIVKGQGVVGNLDSFQLPIALPEKCDLGNYIVEIRRDEKSVTADGATYFSIQEFRPPQFEISVKADNATPAFTKEKISFTTVAKYFSGAPLSRSGVAWHVTANRSRYSPPKWSDYTFQDNRYEQYWDRHHISYANYTSASQDLKGKSNQDGQDEVEMAFTRPPGDYPVLVQAQATVKDFNSQTWSQNASVLVHPSKRYVGLKHLYGWQKDELFKILAVVTDVDGNCIAGDTINLTAEEYPTSNQQNPPPRSFDLGTVKSQEKPVELSIKLPFKGQFQIVAHVVDAEGCKNKTGINVYVPESAPLTNIAKIIAVNTYNAPQRPAQPALAESLQIAPDKDLYKPGDIARLKIRAPFEGAFGTITLSHRGIVFTKPLHMQGKETDIDIPIEGAYIPNCDVSVNLAAPATSETEIVADKRLPVRSICTTLNISRDSRTLDVKVEPQAKMLQPGAQSHLDVQVKYSDGTAAKNTDVCAIIVDESILALTGYAINNPINAFYPENYW